MKNRWRCFFAFTALLVMLTLIGSAETTSARITAADLNLQEMSDEELEEVLNAVLAEQKARIKTKLTLDQSSVKVAKGASVKLNAEVTGLADGVKVAKTSWTSLDTKVATVQQGTVRAVNGGKTAVSCTVTLSDGLEISEECSVEVYVAAMSVTVNPNTVTLGLGLSDKLNPVIKPDNVSSKKLDYSSDAPETVSVDGNGNIKAVGGGKATITVSTTDGSNKSAKVTVYVPSISARTTEFSVESKSGKDFSIDYYGKKENLNVSVAGNAGDVSYQLSGTKVQFSVAPIRAGNVTITVSDKSDQRSRVTLKVTVEHSAVYDATSYPKIKYDDAYRYPDKYLGDNCSFSGKVLQVMDGGSYKVYRISSKGNYDNVVYVTIQNSKLLVPIIEDDRVTVYGRYDGNETYSSIWGQSITIPRVTAERININKQ